MTPAPFPRKNWSSSWTVLEGGILTFFKDSKHSAASALVRAPMALGQGSTHGRESAPMGLGRNSQDVANMCRIGVAPTGNMALTSPLGWEFRTLSRGCRGYWGRGTMANTLRMEPASLGQGKDPQDGVEAAGWDHLP